MAQTLANCFRWFQPAFLWHAAKQQMRHLGKVMIPAIYSKIKKFLGKIATALSPWLEEIAYITLSIALMTTLVVILKTYNGRPLTDWQGAISLGNMSVNISLNFIVAVLGTVSKTSVAVCIEAGLSQSKWIWFRLQRRSLLDYKRFDAASRGPLGSARLLPITKLRDFASLGALVVILGLAFDPFLQLLVSYEGMMGVDPNANASLAFTSFYHEGVQEPNGMTVTNAYDNIFKVAFSGPQEVMEEAIRQSMETSNSSNLFKPNYFCTSQNCTWPPFASLAVCSSCVDVSAHILSKKNSNVTFPTDVGARFNAPGVQYYMLADPATGPSPSEWIEDTYIAQLPYPVLENPEGPRLKYSNYSAEVMATYLTAHPNNTFSFKDSSNLLQSLLVMYSTTPYIDNGADWESQPVSAVECGLTLCTNVYNSAVINGTLVETINNTASSRVPGSYAPISVSAVNASDASIGAISIRNLTDPAFSNDISTPAFQPYPIARTDLSLYAPPGMSGMFNITQASVECLISGLLEQFSGNLLTGSPDPQHISPNITSSDWQLFDEEREITVNSHVTLSSTNIPSSNARLAAMYFSWTSFDSIQISSSNNGSSAPLPLQPYVDGIAHSISSVLRNSGTPPTFQIGTAQNWGVYIQVRWPVITGPAIFVLGSLIFMVSCIWRTNREGLHPWKENPLPALITGLKGTALTDAVARLDNGGWEEKRLESLCREMQVELKDRRRLEFMA